jgi:phosphoenolpyruvate synthase/pyruvate phosphate dikinase
LRRLTVELEVFFRFPVDVEWAISKGKIYILQSRPITTIERK